MASKDNGEHFKLWTPATYRIKVAGHLDESWSDCLGGMRITMRRRTDQAAMTTLVGRMRDQAELMGVIGRVMKGNIETRAAKEANSHRQAFGH